MTKRISTVAALVLLAGSAALPAAAADSSPNPVQEFLASKAQVKSACAKNEGRYFEDSQEPPTYGCSTPTGASVICWEADNGCVGSNSSQPAEHPRRRARRGEASAS